MQSPFDKTPGVIATYVGYTGGDKEDPTYEEVTSGETGHRESVEVVYDPSKVSYAKLLQIFWHNIDPTDPQGQFCDKGKQYRTAIFYLNDEQKHLAEASKAELLQSGKLDKIDTDILPATTFYPAEEYHQEYYKKNPIRYRFYHANSGREKRLKQVWGSSSH